MDINVIQFEENFLNLINIIEAEDKNYTSFNKYFAYGTSGFRYDESELDKIAFRLGIISCIKSQCYEGLPIGIMITASHNKYTDNGFKVAGLEGEGLDEYWEKKFEILINCNNLKEEITKLIEDVIKDKKTNNKFFYKDKKPILAYSYDTRRSSKNLANIIEYHYIII